MWFVAMVTTWTSTSAWAVPQRPCATLEQLPFAPALRRGPPTAGATPVKQLRDTYALPNVRTSRNFALHYGNASGAAPGEIDRLLAAFEDAWAVQVEAMAHPAPASTDTFLFNVYLGDSGDGAPGGYGAAGYYYVDQDGYPMVVVASVMLGDPDAADGTAYHEFYHAIQGSLDRYEYSGVSAWYWEATAEWAAIETDPTNPTNGSFVFSYLLLPQLAVNAFDYPDTGILEEYYQYGAFLFPHDVTQQLGYEVVRDSWTLPGTEPDPLEVLRQRVQDAGEDLDELWLDHLGRNAAYDYAAGEFYAYLTDWYGRYFTQTQVIVDTAPASGGSGRVSGEFAPRRYGAATIQLDAPEPGSLTVEIAGEAQGTAGSPAEYGARLVRITGDDIVYDDVPFTGTDGRLEVAVGGEDRLFLAVGAWTPQWRQNRWTTESFPFDWALRIEAPTTQTTETETETDTDTDTTPDDDDDDAPADDEVGEADTMSGGCGCTSDGSLAGGWLAFGVAASFARRRRTHTVPGDTWFRRR